MTDLEAAATLQRILGKGWQVEPVGQDQALAYRAELTPAGEQFVIPGCERNAAPGARQLDLF